MRQSLLASRADPAPVSCLDAFDDFVGAYAAAGIQDLVFSWPPTASVRRREPVRQISRVIERIAAERIAPLGRRMR